MLPVDEVYEEIDSTENDDKYNNPFTNVALDEAKPNTRYYNGVLPSSNYPAFNESRVNLIE